MSRIRDPSSSREVVKRHLQSMDDQKFEHFIADLWSRNGWKTAVSQQSRDKSLDVLAEKEAPYHQRHAIQAKRYREGNRVGGPKISEYASLRTQFNADVAVVVTTSEFTTDAHERAETLNVKLIDGDDLVRMVARADALDLVAKYSDHTTPTRTYSNGEKSQNTGQQPDEEYPWFILMLFGSIPHTIAVLIYGVFQPASNSLIGQVLIAVILVMGTATVIGIYRDILLIQRSPAAWYPNLKRWCFGAMFIPYLTIPMYLILRYDRSN